MQTVMASCYLLVLVGGLGMVKMPDNTPLQRNAYSWHKSIGALIIALLTCRIFIGQRVWGRKYTRHFPKFTGEWIRTFLLPTAIYRKISTIPTFFI
jgi:cytochrome b561